MKEFTSKLNKELAILLQNIEVDNTDSIKKAHKSINYIRNTLSKLKAFILDYSFRNEEEEILFFKEIKPDIFSKLIYYVKIFNIESRRPMGSYDIQKNFLCQELSKLNFFFNSHLEFYQYYRMNSTYLGR